MKTSMLVCAGLAALTMAEPGTAQGLQLDVHAGADHVRSEGDGIDGATYGLSLTYDRELRGYSLGIGIDVDASDTADCRSDFLLSGDRACVEARRDTALVARLSVPLGARVRLYGLAGYANGVFRARYELAGVVARETQAIDGFRTGPGASLGLGRRLFAKAEYRYTNYEDNVTRHQGLLGIGLRL